MFSFQEGLCGCCSDTSSCRTGCCPFCGSLCLQAKAVQRSTGEIFLCPFFRGFFLLCIGCALNRGKIRMKYEIQGSFCGDLCVWIWCGTCAGCQEYREVYIRNEIPKERWSGTPAGLVLEVAVVIIEPILEKKLDNL